MIDIHYANLTDFDDCLYRQSELIEGDYAYKQCPVFNHRSSRTFVSLSPVDFYCKLDREKKEIQSSDYDMLVLTDSELESPKPIIQLKFPMFLFWSNQKNIWFEFNDHPMTSYSNNFIAISGWFNISNWTRNMSFAITLVDENKPVVIKKGDPLFRFTFHSQDLNSDITLHKEVDNDIIHEKMVSIKSGRENRSWIGKLFSKDETSKCPFSFLYK